MFLSSLSQVSHQRPGDRKENKTKPNEEASILHIDPVTSCLAPSCDLPDPGLQGGVQHHHRRYAGDDHKLRGGVHRGPTPGHFRTGPGQLGRAVAPSTVQSGGDSRTIFDYGLNRDTSIGPRFGCAGGRRRLTYLHLDAGLCDREPVRAGRLRQRWAGRLESVR